MTDLLLNAYVEIHQVRILVFDKYQRCQVPLKMSVHQITVYMHIHTRQIVQMVDLNVCCFYEVWMSALVQVKFFSKLKKAIYSIIIH